MVRIKLIIKYALIALIKSGLTPIMKNYIHTTNFGGVPVKSKGDLVFLRIGHRFKMEERFLSNLDLKSKTVYDIGSNIGITTIFFAKTSGKTGKVIAFEPNPESYLKIKQNVELNGLDNIQILNIGIGNKRERKTLVAHPSDPGTGSMEKNSIIRMLKGWGAKSLQVEVDILDRCIEAKKLPKPDFIKIDIEGMEYNALLGMVETISKYKPSIYIEIHGADEKRKIENIQRIVKFLDLHGYSIYHVESEQVVTSNNAQIAKKGHIFCK
jgi:FkbM family methyltransferase